MPHVSPPPATAIETEPDKPPERIVSPDAPRVGASTLARLIGAHQANIWRYLRFLGADASEADDLTQETFLSIASGKFEERSPRETAAFLRTAARNQLLMLRRNQKRQPAVVELEAAEVTWAAAIDDDEPGAWDGYLAALRGCLEELTDRARKAIDLQYRKRLSRQAAADELGMKPNGVKTLLRRARETLRECIERRIMNND